LIHAGDGEHRQRYYGRTQRYCPQARHSRRRSARQNLPDAPRQRTAGHRHPQNSDSRARLYHRARQFQQIARIIARVVPAFNHRRVAGLFRQRGKLPFQPPREGMEPEDRAIQKRQPLHQRIAAAHMLAFVGEHGIELCRRPGAPGCRQNCRRMQPSDGDRCGARRAGQPAAAERCFADQHVRAQRSNGQP